jgi:hypothetical protein
MKKLLVLFMTVLSVTFSSCEGPQGPPGFDGFDGQDGGLIVSQAFEIEIDFNANNNYEFFEAYGFEVFPTDVTLVYIRWEVIDGQEIWRLLPQNVFFDEGVLIYNFDFTQTDVRFFLDGTIDFGLLDSSYTQNQIFRVVVVPADNVGRWDYSDLSVVMDAYGITSFDKR